MVRMLAIVLLAMLAGMPAFADMDVEAEKREAAKHAATQKPEAERNRAKEQMKSDAAAKANAAMSKHLTEAQRKALGLPPNRQLDIKIIRHPTLSLCARPSPAPIPPALTLAT